MQRGSRRRRGSCGCGPRGSACIRPRTPDPRSPGARAPAGKPSASPPPGRPEPALQEQTSGIRLCRCQKMICVESLMRGLPGKLFPTTLTTARPILSRPCTVIARLRSNSCSSGSATAASLSTITSIFLLTMLAWVCSVRTGASQVFCGRDQGRARLNTGDPVRVRGGRRGW
jgi:hypothetical protein